MFNFDESKYIIDGSKYKLFSTVTDIEKKAESYKDTKGQSNSNQNREDLMADETNYREYK